MEEVVVVVAVADGEVLVRRLFEEAIPRRRFGSGVGECRCRFSNLLIASQRQPSARQMPLVLDRSAASFDPSLSLK